ncbi:hypothetical protein GCM10007315_05300 [Gemmobacter tilapiae]|uniref:Uncharacterized protein n=1 Tax=Neogemmobacter tilapiae TaxID=875041 RepID=A0A918TKV6_9RHOB|nr:hypothetical protein GCM10007315_05300 [Gemmobacter tilapiae]
MFELKPVEAQHYPKPDRNDPNEPCGHQRGHDERRKAAPPSKTKDGAKIAAIDPKASQRNGKTEARDKSEDWEEYERRIESISISVDVGFVLAG